MNLYNDTTCTLRLNIIKLGSWSVRHLGDGVADRHITWVRWREQWSRAQWSRGQLVADQQIQYGSRRFRCEPVNSIRNLQTSIFISTASDASAPIKRRRDKGQQTAHNELLRRRQPVVTALFGHEAACYRMAGGISVPLALSLIHIWRCRRRG